MDPQSQPQFSAPPVQQPPRPQDSSVVQNATPPDAFFHATEDDTPSSSLNTSTVTWTASEFIAHHKSAGWYLILAGLGFLGTLLVYLITRDIISSAVVAIAAGLFGVMASRQPRQLQYSVGNDGLSIGSKSYPYKDFRSFAVVDEGHFSSITFMPLKRFSPPLSIYYPPEEEHRIAEVLALHLPLHPHKRDPIEQLMRQIRF